MHDQEQPVINNINDQPQIPPEEIDHRMGAGDPYITGGDWINDTPISMPGEPALPHTIVAKTDMNIVDTVVDIDRLRKLWARVDDAQREITQNINQITLANYLLDLLQKSRNAIMAGLDQYEEAERYLGEVEHRLGLQKRVMEWSKTIGRNLVVYEVFWLIVFGVMLYIIDRYQVGFSRDIYYFFNSLVWGGLGGVVGALYALWKHIADKQDFDKQYSVWYITNPILGISLGGFVFLVIRAGFFSLTAGTAGDETIQSAAVIYVLAWISGFKQNVVYEIVRRILDVFRVENTEKTGVLPRVENTTEK